MEEAESPDTEVRLNRFIARSGVCSRRKADELIMSGRVEVNGSVVTQLGIKVAPSDDVRVNGTLITPTKHIHVLLNKPRGVITTVRDDRGRKTVLDLIGLENRDNLGLFPVGRLDRDTTGVLLITNDGELGNRLMHPRYEIEKLYTVRTKRSLTARDIERLRDGVDLDGDKVRADHVGFVDRSDVRLIG
ncbi:MAG: pseudouridine synthase, partial [Rhodothermales bacterium]|nr:pseudouridine synthase [Rhodothermales bacterium]